MPTGWQAEVRDARKRLGLSQRAVAERASVSYEALRKYESGARHPSRQHLGRIIDALQLDRGWRNRILTSAGYAADGLEQRPDVDAWWMSAEEAAAETESYPWPAFVLSERGEVLSANTPAQRTWGVDLRREFLDPVERNMLSIASNPRFADRCLNWEEAVTIILRMFKTFHRQPEDLESPTPYMNALLAHFMAGDPKYVGRLAELWQKAPSAYSYKYRTTYPIVWDTPGVGVMRFRCLISPVNEPDGLNINDWIPIDETSWSVLRAITAKP
jgi:transcriptional regulator with XRE-family HTH domain